jgi:enterobacterial common antigen flippase
VTTEKGPPGAAPRIQPADERGPLGDTGTDLVPRMLRVTAAMGLSGGLVIALSAVRTKLVALELGPEGVGSLALLVSLLALATVIGGLGVGSAAVREIAAADAVPDKSGRDALRQTLYRLTIVLALGTAAALAIAARPVAGIALGDYDLTGETRICALAAFLAILATAPLSDLNGLRRIRSLAVVQSFAAIAATGVTIVAFLANTSLLPVVLVAPPAALAAFAVLYARTLPRPVETASARQGLRYSRRLVGVGSGFVLNAGLAAISALVLRLLIESEFGRAGTGEFQAAFVIATYLVTLVFTAYATDYLPLLSGLRDDPTRLNEATNTQLTVGILIAAPAIMALIALAPVAVSALYSGSFEEAPDVLRLMLLGEVVRLASWTVGYILVAKNIPLFIAMEVIYNGLVIAATAVLMPVLELEGTGVAYLLAQLCGLAAALIFARRVSGFRLSRRNTRYLSASAIAGSVVCTAAFWGGWASAIAWVVVVAATYLALRRLIALADLDAPILSRLPIPRPRVAPK